MEISVYDTVFKKEDGTLIKFDVLVPAACADLEKIYSYANSFLHEERISAKNLISADECVFCHIEVATEAIENDIRKKGYSVFRHWGF